MKKNISINISGIIFHIEEDGYEQLKKYLESINTYFSTFDESNEIVADIEGRIAEIFLSKLTEENQVITLEDVETLIKTMGSISDFEAIEEPETEAVPPEPKIEESAEEPKTKSEPKEAKTKKLYRDQKRKLLGGVAAGIAHYFTVDPLWIRLIFAIFLVGGIPGAGLLIITYVIFWIVVPTSADLEEDDGIKKMFRNPEGKVLGGVANGLAAYFGTDVTLVRVIFFLSIFLGGAGLLLYIILWIITPEAKSITEKMQMQGEPVTLSGIESTIKESLKVDEGEENMFVKILLFPFRLIATVFNGLGKAIGPLLLFLVEVIRVFAGALMVLIGVSIIFSIVVGIGVLIGIIQSPDYFFELPVNFFTQTFPLWPSIGLFVSLFIPALILALLGVSVIAKRILFNATFGWSMFSLWVIAVLFVAFMAPSAIAEYRSEGRHRETSNYDLQGKTAVIKLNEIGSDNYNSTTLKIRGHSDSTFKLVKEYESHGKSRKDAEINASNMIHKVSFEDSIFYIDSDLQYKEGDIFRWQELEMVLYVPYGQKFMMDEDVKKIIRNTIHRYGYTVDDMGENTWTFNEGGMICLTCPDYDPNDFEYEGDEDDGEGIEGNFESYYDADPLPGYLKEYELSNIDQIIISSIADVNIIGSKENKLIISGSEEYAAALMVEIYGSTLDIDHKNKLLDFDLKRDRDRVKIDILIPEVSQIKLETATNAFVAGFNSNDLTIDLSSASKLTLEGSIDNLFAELSGASHLKLRGNADRFTIDSGGSSRVDALDFIAKIAEVDAGGASQVRINASESLDIEASGLSNVRYKGDAKISIDQSSTSTISKY